ncbi:MAG: F0F1 ATP synthase subunit alpha [Deltaproteobacteria bacterium]|nr:F0F1 ATP synthase subunit alpha [Deltaproteobacteria bacterium]
MSVIRPEEIASIVEQEIEHFDKPVELEEEGSVIQVGDGIALVYGLERAMAGELLRFPGNVEGLVLNLEQHSVGVALLGSDRHIKEGDPVTRTGLVASVPVGPALVGRVVDPIGQALDGGPEVDIASPRMPLDIKAPGVLARQPVTEPLMTGLKAIDSMVPIGRGQRELIIGDRGTGKTAIAVDTILNQKGKGVWCVYVAVGQKASSVAMVVERLREQGAMEYTTVVAATADKSASLLYIAPYSGCTMAEYFRDRGEAALVVYDDLSKHAAAYRQLSLLLRRPPGREAYPGDVFYLHSRLLERASKLQEHYVIVKKTLSKDVSKENLKGIDDKVYRGKLGKDEAAEVLAQRSDKDDLELRRIPDTGGSLTALPIIETQSGDVSAYIPTNVISITDGQIYLEPDLFYAGVRPAVNVGLSVSRVGGNAQSKAMKQIGGRIRLDLAQYRELAAFAQFGADLDASTKAKLTRGERMVELLKQDQYQPLALWQQIAGIQTGVGGFLDDLDQAWVQPFQLSLFDSMTKDHPELVEILQQGDKLSKELLERLNGVIEKAKQDFVEAHKEEPHQMDVHMRYPGGRDVTPNMGHDGLESRLDSDE